VCHAIRHSVQSQSTQRQSRYRRAAQLLVLTVTVSFSYGLAVSPYFAIRDIQIHAPDSALAKLALTAIKVPVQASTLLYPVQRIAKQLEDYPEIKQASIKRDLPSRLIVHIQRRYPVAAIKTDGQWALVDKESVCVAITNAPPDSLTRFYGLTSSPLMPGERLNGSELRLLRETLAGLENCPDTEGLVMDFVDRHLIQIHSPSGVLGKLGSSDNLKRKIKMFLAIMEQLEEKGRRPAYIDVRIMEQPVWKPQPQP